ncbi:MAG: hypothetical protein FJ083_08100 [Cyanobacteria bacterium K_Offshore_surface_m2_239]|nr:hypothetical protein [Cyanobacteria bacterium K_Offshore_surface_m2_239]
MTDATLPPPAPGHWDAVTDDPAGFRIFQRGRHLDGTFIRVYVPKQAEVPGQTLRAILYLHGFALCLPSFYEAHLRELAAAGWIVFFPDFQRSTYREESLEGARRRGGASRSSHAPLTWGRTTLRLLRRKREEGLRLEDLPEAMAAPRDARPSLRRSLPDLRVRDLRRVLLPWLLIRLLLSVIGWFRRNYARNLGELIGTVLLSLAYAPTDWLRNALTLTENAWTDLSQEPSLAHWQSDAMEMYGFGHSLGGLLSLSIPSLTTPEPPARFQPKAILAADPATSTEMGIPGFVIALLKLFNAPFTAEPLRIQVTGPQIQQPVAILHGLADTLVPPQLWAVQGGGGAFTSVGGPAKALYFASSNQQRDPNLVAFHNQAVTSTQTYDDDLFEAFGGVKDGPNAYNTTWIWPALHLLFQKNSDPAALLRDVEQRPEPPPFAISTDPPAPARRWWPWLLAAAGFVALGILVWRLRAWG